jgi:hypothetical protein
MRNDLSRERNFVVLRSAVLLVLRRTQVLDYSCSILHQRPRGSMPPARQYAGRENYAIHVPDCRAQCPQCLA